jgi:hypothetical protein
MRNVDKVINGASIAFFVLAMCLMYVSVLTNITG